MATSAICLDSPAVAHHQASQVMWPITDHHDDPPMTHAQPTPSPSPSAPNPRVPTHIDGLPAPSCATTTTTLTTCTLVCHPVGSCLPPTLSCATTPSHATLPPPPPSMHHHHHTLCATGCCPLHAATATTVYVLLPPHSRCPHLPPFATTCPTPIPLRFGPTTMYPCTLALGWPPTAYPLSLHSDPTCFLYMVCSLCKMSC